MRALRLRGGKFQLLLTGHVQLRGHLTAQSSQVTGGAILEELGGKRVMLGLVNPEQQASDPPVAVTLRSTTTHAPFVCS